MPTEPSRRRFLEASGVLVGAGAFGSFAGCIDTGGGGSGDGGSDSTGDDGSDEEGEDSDGEDTENGDESEENGGAQSYSSWLYEPGIHLDSDHYAVSYRANAEIASYQDEFDGDVYDNMAENFESSYEFLALDFDEVESETTFGGYLAAVLNGYQVERSSIVSSLEDEEYEDDGEYEGFQVFLAPDESQAVGLTNEEILLTSSSFDGDAEALEVLETAVDTHNGDENRYVEEHTAFAELMDQLNAGSVVFARTSEETEETDVENGQFEGVVASGSAQLVTGDTMQVQVVMVFDSAEDIDTDDIEEWTETATFDAITDTAVSTSGRSAVVTGTTNTDEYGT